MRQSYWKAVCPLPEITECCFLLVHVGKWGTERWEDPPGYTTRGPQGNTEQVCPPPTPALSTLWFLRTGCIFPSPWVAVMPWAVSNIFYSKSLLLKLFPSLAWRLETGKGIVTMTCSWPWGFWTRTKFRVCGIDVNLLDVWHWAITPRC